MEWTKEEILDYINTNRFFASFKLNRISSLIGPLIYTNPLLPGGTLAGPLSYTMSQTPSAQTPPVQAPSVQAPSAQAPPTQAPSVQAPSAQAPLASPSPLTEAKEQGSQACISLRNNLPSNSTTPSNHCLRQPSLPSP